MEAARRGSHCEAEAGIAERKKQRLSSEMLKRKQTKGSGWEAENPEGESEREAPEEQLWEVNQGRAKGNKQEAEYGNLEGRHERSGWRERGQRRSESGGAHRENP